MFCKNCGKIALPDSKFCEYCGTRLDATLLQTEEITQLQQPQQDPPQYGRQAQINKDFIGTTPIAEFNSKKVGQIRKFEELEEKKILAEDELQTKKQELLSKEITPPQKRISRDTTFHCSGCNNQFKVKEGMLYPEYCPYCGYVSSELSDVTEDMTQPQQPQYEAPQYGQQVQYPSNQQPSYVSGNQPRLPRKSPIISTILSLLIAGLGQIYLGRFRRGAAWFIGGVILGILSGGVLAIFIWIGAAIDSYLLAKDYNRKLGYSE